MNIASLRRKLDVLEGGGTGDLLLIVTLPDGTRAKKTPQEWWDHRHSWKWDYLNGIAMDSPRGWPPFLLFMAKGYDASYKKAIENGGFLEYTETIIDEKGRFKDVKKRVDADYYKNERDDALAKFNITGVVYKKDNERT